MYEDGPDGMPRVTGLRMTKAGKEQVVEADAYIAALDVPGAKKLIPQVGGNDAGAALLGCYGVMIVSVTCSRSLVVDTRHPHAFVGFVLLLLCWWVQLSSCWSACCCCCLC